MIDTHFFHILHLRTLKGSVRNGHGSTLTARPPKSMTVSDQFQG